MGRKAKPTSSKADDGLMTFEEIGAQMGISRQCAEQYYRRALHKLARDAEAIRLLTEWNAWCWQLRARSAESRWSSSDWREEL